MAIPISAWCGTDAETYYGISLFGEEISSNNLTGTIPSSFGTGSYSFDPATRTLTITNMLVNMNEELVGLKGGIIESGTPRELIAKRGIYYDLYMAQFKEVS